MTLRNDRGLAGRTWTRLEWILLSAFLVVSLLWVVEHRRNGRSGSIHDTLATTPPLSPPLVEIEADTPGGEPILDEADPEQVRNIHVPGQAAVSTNTVSTVGGTDPSSQMRRHEAALKAAAIKRALDRDKDQKKRGHVLSEQEIEATLASLEGMEWGPEAERKLNDFMRQWGNQDPVAALDYALGIESNRARSGVLKSVFGAWLKQDPTTARAWFYKMVSVDPSGVDVLAGLVFKGQAGNNLTGVMADIIELPGNSLKRSALSTVVSQLLAQNNLTALFAIHASLAPGLDRDLVTEAIVRGAGIYEPTLIGQWALSLQDAHSRQLALDGIVKTWSADQPASASEWVMKLDDPDERSREIAFVAQNWAREDAVATGDWLLSMNPPSAALDPAVTGFVKSVMKDNPSGAMAWANTVSDEKQRNSLLTQVGKQWIKSDMEAALAFVNQSTLPDSVKKAILAADPGR
jgi:hypothetical protein